jgi:DNA modification methylase
MEWMADETVQCCVTSPPYFGLRDYGHEGQIGLEKTLEEYVRKMVEVFREVRRILKPDGTLWLNLGDSYAANKRSGSTSAGFNARYHGQSEKTDSKQVLVHKDMSRVSMQTGLHQKQLLGMPWRVAFALQADGWYLRQDIIWCKSNPMPESVTDRCTKSHEYIFLMSKSPKYYFDHEAIKEPAAPSSLARWAQDIEGQAGSNRVPGKTNGNMKAVGGPRSKRDSFKRTNSKRAQAIPGQRVGTHREDREESTYDTAMRNRRSVWDVATRPYKEAHFATYPPKLIEPCILAGSRPGDVVFDPFGGSGTTAAVALLHGRRAITCELNPEYIKLIKQRTSAAMIEYEEL